MSIPIGTATRAHIMPSFLIFLSKLLFLEIHKLIKYFIYSNLFILVYENHRFSPEHLKMEFQMPGAPPGMSHNDESFLGALTSPDNGPPGFPPPGAFHPGFPHGPPGGPPMG